MAERSVKVTLAADISQYVAQINKASAVTEAASKKIGDAVGPSGASGKLKGFGAEMGRATNFVRTHDQQLRTVSTGMLAFGAAAAVGVGMAVKTYADFDEQMSHVKATGADAAQNIDALRKAAMDAGRDFGQFTGRDAAEGIEELSKAGVSAADILGGALTGALSLAAAGTINVGEAAEYTSKTMAQFQLQGRDAGHISDVLAAAAGKAVGEVGDFGQALAQTGLVANQYGVSLEETVGTLALFAQNSLIGSDAGTSMKAMLLQLAQPTKQAQKALDAYNISAYDAQGQFVGMEGLAEQLQERLGKLSQEQQNAALKTIFGADAIRAASLLMREGGEGVRRWTEDVSESGYAAQVAATKMDNLKGDLAALGGSWENLMIGMGEGANSPLRNAVQSLTGFVDKLGETPSAVQSFAIGAAAITGGAALVAGGLMKGVTAAVELHDSWRTLVTDSPKLAGAFKGAAIAAGIYAAALITAQVAESVIGDERMVTNLEGTVNALLAAAKAAEGLDAALTSPDPFQYVRTTQAVNDELDKMFRKRDGSAIYADVDTLGKALDQLGNKGGFQRALDGMGKFTTGLLGLTTAEEKMAGQVAAIDEGLVHLVNNGAPERASVAFAQIAEQARQNKVSYDSLLQLFPEYQRSLEAQANQLEVTGLSAEDYVKWMGGDIPAAVAQAAATARQSGKDISGLANITEDSAAASKAAAEAALDLRDAYLGAASAALQLSGSEMGLEAAIDDATASLEENGETLDIGTEAGRANRSALDGIAAAALNLIDSQIKTGASNETLAATTEKSRAAFIKAATQMDMNATEAAALADKYGLIPSQVTTNVDLNGADKAIADASRVQRAIDALTGKTIYVTTVYDSTGAVRSNVKGNEQMKASGGSVWGAGTSTSDSIPAWLSNGEFVIRTAAARAIGYDRLEWLNRTGELPRFANGGQVGGTYSSPVMQQVQVSLPSGPMQIVGTLDLGDGLTGRIEGVLADVAADNNRRRAY